jgi:HEXXH motif-containing protein
LTWRNRCSRLRRRELFAFFRNLPSQPPTPELSSDMETIDLAPFSRPDHDALARRSLLELLLVEHAQHQTNQFLSRAAPRIAEASSGLLATLSTWAAGPATLAQAQGFPLALATFHKADHDPVWVAALAATHLHAEGFEGDWCATFARPSALRFATFVTPALRKVAVSARAGEVSFKPDGHVSAAQVLSCMPPDGWLPLRSAHLGHGTLKVFDGETGAVLPIVNEYGYAPQPTLEVVQTLERAGALLHRFAPGFLTWVTDSVWGLVPIRNQNNLTSSLSTRTLYGVPFIGFPVEPMLAAELLVHEASHQYYHYVQLRTEPCNNKDTSLYPSPYAKKGRTIDWILVAFHAFANIVLLYREMLAAGLDEGQDTAKGGIAYHLPILTAFSDALTQSPGLTEAGRMLFEPLREQLIARPGAKASPTSARPV